MHHFEKEFVSFKKFENIDEVVKIAIDRINEIREIVSQSEPKKTVED